ncbi:MAG: hypothetical protein ACLF0P_02565 [Thermoanaerobaculia bacterium]
MSSVARSLMPSAPVIHWSVLAALLAALLLGAATFDRGSWPSVVGDEATYLMQAESLAWDRDLEYSRRDYERFVRHREVPPEGLILQKGGESESLVYGKPFFYALWSAPFVRLSPTRGPFVANALLLALAAVASARALRRPMGPAAPSWIALAVFGSVAFAHVFWAHLDLFLMSLAALGLALTFGAGRVPPDGRSAARTLLRWTAAGLLLATVAYSRPVYLPLYLPALVVARRRGGWRGVAGLAAGTVLLGLGSLVVQQSLAGSWSSYGAERRSFYSATGFPEVDLPAEDWDALIERWGNASWLKPAAYRGLSAGTPRLWAWNLVYFFAGRAVGLLPYLLPGLLGFLTWWRAPPGAARWGLLAAVAVTALGFLVLRPFNFYGGGGALANRYILPVYPALWFVPTRPLRAPWLAVAALVAAPFLWPLWTAPRAFPVDEHGQFRHVSAVARAVLPYETTQSHMKPTGPKVNVHHRGLWIKSVAPAVWTPDAGGVFLFDPRLGPAELLVGSEEPLQALHLEVGAGAPPFRVEGGRVTGAIELDGGRTRLWIELDEPRARHPMWWLRDRDFTLYLLGLDVEERSRRSTGDVPVEITLAPSAR